MDQEVYLEFANLEGEHWWFKGRRRYLKQIISTYFPKGEDGKVERLFCEIGSGTGGNLAMLAEVSTVDAIEMNAVARDLIGKKKIAGLRSVQDGYLPDNIPLTDSYDGVFSLDVIEHVEQDLEALKQLASLVKPTGYIITTVPAYQWLWSEHDVANHHKRRYTLKQYRQLLIDAGLEVHYASYFNTLLFPLAALSRVVSKVMPSRNSKSAGTLSMPPKPLNSLLQWVFSLESAWAAKLAMPFGLSIVVVASLPSTKHV